MTRRIVQSTYDLRGWAAIARYTGFSTTWCKQRARAGAVDRMPVEHVGRRVVVARSAELDAWVTRQLRAA